MFLHLSVILFTEWGVHDRGCAWQGVCMAGGVHGRGSINGMGGHAWQGACMAGGQVWQGVCACVAGETATVQFVQLVQHVMNIAKVQPKCFQRQFLKKTCLRTI